jgi:ADP-heptose:LPS heptosyltransferase
MILNLNSFIFIILDSLLLLVPRGRSETGKPKLLLVRLDMIGDYLLWLDALRGIEKLYPSEDYQVVLLGNVAWYKLAEKNNYFSEVYPLKRSKFRFNVFYRFWILYRIRRTGFQIVISPVISREFYFADCIVRVSGAARSIGVVGELNNNFLSWQKRWSNHWYTDLLQINKGSNMELLRNAEFIRQIGLPEFSFKRPVIEHSIEINCQLPADYFVLFPGAGWPGRQWPAEKFQKIALRVQQETGWIGIIAGSYKEKSLAQKIYCEGACVLEDWTGQTDLLKLIELIKHSNLVITNETSAAHIAAAVNIPVIVIVGGGHYGRFFPYQTENEKQEYLPILVSLPMPCFNCNWNCCYPLMPRCPVPCIENISVELVWEKILELIKR